MRRGIHEGLGDGDDEERRPGVPDELSDEPNIEPRDPQSVQVEPGGETEAEQNGCAAHEDADAEVDGEVAGTCRDAPAEVESTETRRDAPVEGERWSATTHERSSTDADENDQRTSEDVEDVPEDPPVPPPPPDRPANASDEPPIVELEGEKKSTASCDNAPTRAKADASGASEGIDDSNRPMKLRNMSEHQRERSKTRSQENSPGRPGEEPDEPGGEAAVPRDVHSTQEGPRYDSDGGGGETSTSRRGNGPRGQLGLQGDSRVVEGVRDRRNVVDSAGYDRIRPRSDGNERVEETNAPCRDRGPGGHPGERVESGDAEGGRERQSDGDGDETDRRQGGEDGARSDSKRVDTSPLAEVETGQHGRRDHRMTHAHRPSTPPPTDHRHPTDQPNPPHRRGRIKTRPRNISTNQWTYQVMRTRRGRIGRIGPIGYGVYGVEMSEKRSRGGNRDDEAVGIDRGRPRALSQHDRCASRDLLYKATT